MKGGKKTPPYIPDQRVVPGRVELPTSTLSVWRSNQLSYRTSSAGARNLQHIRKEQEDKQQKNKPETVRKQMNDPTNSLSRKEVFQPHLPVRLPCYDLAPITGLALGRSSRLRTSGTPGFHGLTGGVYKARERIHRAMADARLLANPASWGRVADPNPNYGRV